MKTNKQTQYVFMYPSPLKCCRENHDYLYHNPLKVLPRIPRWGEVGHEKDTLSTFFPGLDEIQSEGYVCSYRSHDSFANCTAFLALFIQEKHHE